GRRHTRFSRDWSSDVCSSDLVALNGNHGEAGHGGGQRLGATHAAQTASQDPAPFGFAVEVLIGHREKGFVGTLHDSLGTYVDPGDRKGVVEGKRGGSGGRERR